MLKLLTVMSDFTENIRAISSAAHEDLKEANLRDKLGFYATGLGLAAHQIGMEAVLFAAGTNAYVAGHDTLGYAAPLAVGAVNGLLSLGIETGLTRGTARGLTTFSTASQQITERFIITNSTDADAMNKLEDSKAGKRGIIDKLDQASVAISVGSAATVLMNYTKHPTATVEDHRKVGLQSARALGGLNAIVGTAIGTGILISEKFGTDSVYNGVETVADSPYTYAVILGYIGIRGATAVIKRHKKRNAADIQPPTLDDTTSSSAE